MNHIQHLVPSQVTLGHLVPFLGSKGPVSGPFRAPKGLDSLIKWPFGSPQRGPMVQKSVSDVYL